MTNSLTNNEIDMPTLQAPMGVQRQVGILYELPTMPLQRESREIEMPYKDPEKEKAYNRHYRNTHKKEISTYMKRYYSIPNNKERQRGNSKRHYHQNRDRILANQQIYYLKNKEKIDLKNKKYQEEHKEETKAYQHKYHKKKQTTDPNYRIRRKKNTQLWQFNNPERVRDNRRKWAKEHPDKIRGWKDDWQKEHNYKIRKQCLMYYSKDKMECKCCGEKIERFLTIDAINFKSHKKVTGSGVMFWKWLIKNNFPRGFRVLCWNCNIGRAFNGDKCPHEELKRKKREK